MIFNRIRSGFDPPATQEIPPVLAVIGDDDAQAQNDMLGESVFSLPDDAPVLRGAAQALDALLQENGS